MHLFKIVSKIVIHLNIAQNIKQIKTRYIKDLDKESSGLAKM